MKKSKYLHRYTAIVALLALLMGLVGCSSGGGNAAAPAPSTDAVLESAPGSDLAAQDGEFQEKLYAILENVVPNDISGDKAATIIVPENVYETYVSLEATPEEFRTSNASEVRYVIRRYEGKEIVGHYTSGSRTTGAAFQWHYTVEIEDLKRNGALDIKEFLGGEPPAVVKDGESHIGSLPDLEEINAWIIETINKGEFVNKQPLLVKVPEGWGTPYIEYLDPKGVAKGRTFKQLISDGEWYSIMLPISTTEISIYTSPFSDGEVRYTETFVQFGNRPGWIIVEDLDGSASYYDHDPTA